MQRTLNRILVLAGIAAQQSEALEDTGAAVDIDVYRAALHVHARMESIILQAEEALAVLEHMLGRHLEPK